MVYLDGNAAVPVAFLEQILGLEVGEKYGVRRVTPEVLHDLGDEAAARGFDRFPLVPIRAKRTGHDEWEIQIGLLRITADSEALYLRLYDVTAGPERRV